VDGDSLHVFPYAASAECPRLCCLSAVFKRRTSRAVPRAAKYLGDFVRRAVSALGRKASRSRGERTERVGSVRLIWNAVFQDARREEDGGRCIQHSNARQGQASETAKIPRVEACRNGGAVYTQSPCRSSCLEQILGPATAPAAGLAPRRGHSTPEAANGRADERRSPSIGGPNRLRGQGWRPRRLSNRESAAVPARVRPAR
jgi:hypothetical protein